MQFGRGFNAPRSRWPARTTPGANGPRPGRSSCRAGPRCPSDSVSRAPAPTEHPGRRWDPPSTTAGPRAGGSPGGRAPSPRPVSPGPTRPRDPSPRATPLTARPTARRPRDAALDAPLRRPEEEVPDPRPTRGASRETATALTAPTSARDRAVTVHHDRITPRRAGPAALSPLEISSSIPGRTRDVSHRP